MSGLSKKSDEDGRGSRHPDLMRNVRAVRPRRVCYFCGKTGQITKEHVWAQWMDKDVEVEGTRYTRTIGFARTADDAFTELPTVEARRQGSVLTTKVREVCKDCNSGWMSRMEAAVEPLLARLWSNPYTSSAAVPRSPPTRRP